MSYLYTVNIESGELTSFYRLEFEPILTVPNKNFLIQIYDNNTMLIYKENKAVWKVKLDFEVLDILIVNVLN